MKTRFDKENAKKHCLLAAAIFGKIDIVNGLSESSRRFFLNVTSDMLNNNVHSKIKMAKIWCCFMRMHTKEKPLESDPSESP